MTHIYSGVKYIFLQPYFKDKIIHYEITYKDVLKVQLIAFNVNLNYFHLFVNNIQVSENSTFVSHLTG